MIEMSKILNLSLQSQNHVEDQSSSPHTFRFLNWTIVHCQVCRRFCDFIKLILRPTMKWAQTPVFYSAQFKIYRIERFGNTTLYLATEQKKHFEYGGLAVV